MEHYRTMTSDTAAKPGEPSCEDRGQLGGELALLRRVTEHLAIREIAAGRLTEQALDATGLALSQPHPEGRIGLLSGGVSAFTRLSETLLSRLPSLDRGLNFNAYQNALLHLLVSQYLGKNPTTIGINDIISTRKKIIDWCHEQISPRRLFFLPCLLTQAWSSGFTVGPVQFIYIDQIKSNPYYTQALASEMRIHLDNMITSMKRGHAHWLAITEIGGCDKDRGQKFAELSVDLAIVALQLSQPHLGTKTMSRLAAYRGQESEFFLSLSDGYFEKGQSMTAPGIPMGHGYLGQVVTDATQIITAVGACIRSFTTGSFRFPSLEQAWCDAAYWLHEGLAEPHDAIAVTKFETAIEVLLKAENARGSQQRIMVALETFFGLKPNDPITSGSDLTAKKYAKRCVEDRSCVLHGTRSTLNARLTSARGVLEHLAVTLVRATACELVLYEESTEPKDEISAFLSWVKSRRTLQA